MDKDQPDSLATVAVVSEKMPQTHSHYAPSEVYSSTEPPPAYMRPAMKSSAVQITRIVAVTLITMSVVMGSFILAASWVQARASCTPESIAAMQAELKLQQQQQQQQQQTANNYQQGEFLKRLQPEALIQDPVEAKENLQSLSESAPVRKEGEPETKEVKSQKEEENNPRSDNESGDHEEDDDDYDDDEFPPVHIKLPLQLDLDDIAGTLIQQARSRVSCVVERRRADEVMDGTNDNTLENNTDSQHYQRLSGERVAILCESGNPNQEQQEQEMLTPIIVPLGTVQIPLQTQESNPAYHQYQIHTQYQVPDMQQLPLSDPRGLNHIPAGLLPPELRNLPQLTMEMRPPRMGAQSLMVGPQPQLEMRQIPIELRHYPMDPMRAMRPPMPQEQRHEPQQLLYQQAVPEEQTHNVFNQEQGAAMMPPPPPPPPQPQMQQMQQTPQVSQIPQEPPVHEHRPMPHMMIPQTEQRPPVVPQQLPDRPRSPFQGIPLEIRRIIQQVPLEIKNIIQHITGEARPPFPIPVPEGARRENVQEFKPFPEGARPIPLGPFPLPVEVRNLLEHGNIEGRQRADGSDEQQEAKPFPGPEEESEEVERNFPVPAEIRNIIHQVVEGRAFPVPRFAMPLRPVESLEVPVEARAEVTDGQSNEQLEHQSQTQQQPTHLVIQQQHQHQQQQPQQRQQQPQEHEEESRPHYVQPRSVRSIPEPFAHRREKRVRRCACDCAC